jgi:predicted nucleic acid-binding Zn ribbon protein
MQQAGPGLQKIVAQVLRQTSAEQSALLAWPLACGARVAEKTRAVSLEDHILRVEVPDRGWREQLKTFAPRYLATINQYSNGCVLGIAFVVAGENQSR